MYGNLTVTQRWSSQIHDIYRRSIRHRTVTFVCYRSRRRYRAEVDGLPTKQSRVISVLTSSDLSMLLTVLVSHLPLSLFYLIAFTSAVPGDAGPTPHGLQLAVITLLADTAFKLALLTVRLVRDSYRYFMTHNDTCRHIVTKSVLRSASILLLTAALVLLVNMVTACRWWLRRVMTDPVCGPHLQIRIITLLPKSRS